MREALTIREESFVTQYIKLGVAIKAAIAAGWKAGYAKKNAHKILQRPHIARAISESQADLRKNAKYELKEAVAEADLLIKEARENKQYSAASSIFIAKQKILGIFVERQSIALEVKPSIVEAIEAGRNRVASYMAESPRLLDITPAPTPDPVPNPFWRIEGIQDHDC